MMIDQIHELFSALDDFQGCPPTDVLSFVSAAPPAGTLPPPQSSWTLLALGGYRQRKRWAWDTLTRHLEADIQRHPACRLTLEDLLEKNVHGIVPGLPEWEFDLDGNCSFLIHRVSGERIHIDALNGPELMVREYFVAYVKDHPDPGPAERRLIELFPSVRGLEIAIRFLARSGLIHDADESDFELCGIVDDYHDRIEVFCQAWSRSGDRVWLGAQIGDWPAAHEAAILLEIPELTAVTGPRAEECSQLWLDQLHSEATRHGLYDDLLYALSDSGAEEVRHYIEQALDSGSLAYDAIEIIGDDRSWCPKVYEFLGRFIGKRGSYGLPDRCAIYLARHRYRLREVIGRFISADLSEHRVAIRLALEHAPDMLGPLLRKALRSRNERSRLTAAAVLAVLDTDWSRQELISILEESDDLDLTVECRSALRESRDPKAQRAVDEWEQRHPELEEPPVSSARFWYRRFQDGCPSALSREMSDLFDLVMKVRGLEIGG